MARRKIGPRRWAKKLGIPMPPTKKQMLLKQLDWYETHELGINGDYVLLINKLVFLEMALKDLAPAVFQKYKGWAAKMEEKIKVQSLAEAAKNNEESKA